MVVTWSKAGPLMHSACTSDEIVSGRKPLASMARAVLKANEPLPWPMSNLHAALARLEHLLLHGALRAWPASWGTGRNAWVSTSPGRSRAEHLLVARRRMVDVAHQRHARPRRPPAARCRAARCRSCPRRTRPTRTLMPTITSRLAFGHLHRVDRVHQAQLLALAHHHAVGEGVDAGVRDVQIGEDAHLARLDHVLAEAGEIAGPGAAGIDRRW